MFGAWERFNDKLAIFQNHEVLEKMFLDIFNHAIDPLNKTVVNNSKSGSLVKLHHHVPFLLIRDVSKKYWSWHTREAKVTKIPSTTSTVDNRQRKWNEEK